MDHLILSRLQHAEVDLLDALVKDEYAMERFANDWATLSTDIQNALQCGSLNESTISTIHLTASRISIISQNFLDFRTQADALASDLTSELEQLLSDVTLEGSPKDSHSTLTTGAHDSHARNSCASHIEPSCRWLLQNLHDPYPPKRMKESIARQAGCPIKDIDNWFVEARRRIGWSALRRSHFSNKRQCIVEAASRFFGKTAAAPRLGADLELEFANIQMQAENLYLHRFFELPSESGGDSREMSGPSRPRKRRSASLQTGSSAAQPSRLHRVSDGDFSGRTRPTGDPKLGRDTYSTEAHSSVSSVTPLKRSCSSPADCSNNKSPASMSPLHELPPSKGRDSVPTASSLKRKRQQSTDEVEKSKRPRSDYPDLPVFDLPPWNPSIPSAEDAFGGADLSGPLDIEPFNLSEFLGSSDDLGDVSLTRTYNLGKAGAIASDNRLQVESQGEKVTPTNQSSNHPVVSVTQHSDVTIPPLFLNDPSCLDITLDGLADQIFGSGALSEWLTPLFEDPNVNWWMQPDTMFQLDPPPINDIFSLNLPLSSTVY